MIRYGLSVDPRDLKGIHVDLRHYARDGMAYEQIVGLSTRLAHGIVSRIQAEHPEEYARADAYLRARGATLSEHAAIQYRESEDHDKVNDPQFIANNPAYPMYRVSLAISEARIGTQQRLNLESFITEILSHTRPSPQELSAVTDYFSEIAIILASAHNSTSVDSLQSYFTRLKANPTLDGGNAATQLEKMLADPVHAQAAVSIAPQSHTTKHAKGSALVQAINSVCIDPAVSEDSAQLLASDADVSGKPWGLSLPELRHPDPQRVGMQVGEAARHALKENTPEDHGSRQPTPLYAAIKHSVTG